MMYRFVCWLATILIMVSAFLAFILTPFGSKAVFNIAIKFVPGKLSYQKFSGTLIGPLTISGLDYQHQNNHISIQQISLKWNPVALLSGHVSIKNLVVYHMDIITSSSIERDPSSPKNFLTVLNDWSQKQLNLPISIKIQNATFQKVRFGHDDHHWLVNINQATAYGTLFANQLDFHVEVNLKLPKMLIATTQASNAAAHLMIYGDISGRLDHYHLQLKLKNPYTNWLVSGEGGPQSILLKTSQTKLFNGELTAELGFNWQNDLTWQIQLDATQINLSMLKPKLPSKVNMQLKSSGFLKDNMPHFIWYLDLNTANNQIHTEGQRNDAWDASWNLNITQLNELLPSSHGSIKSEGQLTGNWPNLMTQGELTGQNIVWRTYSASQIESQWSIDFSQKQDTNFNLSAKQVNALGFSFDALSLNSKGSFKQHTLMLTASDQDNELSALLVGQGQASAWQGVIKQLSFHSTWLNDWQISKPANLSINQEKFQLNNLCLNSNSNQACISVSKDKEDWQTTVTSALNLHDFNFFPEGTSIELPIKLDLNATGNRSQIKTATAMLTLAKGQIILTHDETLQIPLQGGKLSVDIKPALATFDLQFNLNPNNFIHFNLKLPNYSPEKLENKQQAIQGELNVHFSDLKTIDDLIPHLSLLPGALQGKWSIAGTIAKPHVNGQLTLNQSKIMIPELNVVLENLKLTGNLDQHLFNFKLLATSAGRPIQAEGQIDFTKPGFPITIHVTGNHVLIMNTQEFVVYADPDLNIKIEGFNVDLTGHVSIPQATIAPVNIKGVVTLPKYDVVIVGGPQKKLSPWHLEAEVSITLGNQISLNVMGLKGRLIGDAIITHHHRQPTTADGHVTIVDGHYTIMGRELTVAPNSGITYRDNPLENPNLNIQVFTYVTVNDTTGQELIMDNVKVSAIISGTASAPQLSFSSSPITLSPNDILSYLVLGSPGNAASAPAASGLLLQALNALKPNKQTPTSTPTDLSSELKQGLGISELGVETDTELAPLGETTNRQTTYVVFGKRITPRLFARYKIDPLSSNNIFTLYYLLTQHIRIQSEKTNLGTGADILYTIERKHKKQALKQCDEEIATTH